MFNLPNTNHTHLHISISAHYVAAYLLDYIVHQHAGTNCTQPAIDDFPRDLFTEQQRQSGAVVLHAICSLYLFLALAVVCDKYFVPAVEKICTGRCPRFGLLCSVVLVLYR